MNLYTDDELKTLSASAEAESARLDYKAAFDIAALKDWCEVVKDIVAMANSGGGAIIFGINDDGSPAGTDLGRLASLDPAVITDKLSKYIGQQFSDFRLIRGRRGDSDTVILAVGSSNTPLVFTAPGTYEVPTAGKQQQKTAFSKGTVYVRHGAKSEPATSADLRDIVEREVERQRASWLDGIRKVVSAPAGSTVSILPAEVAIGNPGTAATGIRLTHDAAAPALKAPDFDKMYPYRQKEVLEKLRAQLPGIALTGHDLLCLRRQHHLDDDPTYSLKHKFGSRQYSDALVDWVVTRYQANAFLFQEARDAHRRAVEENASLPPAGT